MQFSANDIFNDILNMKISHFKYFIVMLGGGSSFSTAAVVCAVNSVLNLEHIKNEIITF